MKSKLCRIFSAFALFACLCFMTVYATGSAGLKDSPSTGDVYSKDGMGIMVSDATCGVFIGLAQCKNGPMYTPSTLEDRTSELATYVHKYNQTYYTRIPNENIIDLSHTTNSVLSVINASRKNHSNSAYTEWVGGAMVVKPEKVVEVMEAICSENPNNKSYYDLYKKQVQSITPYYPVVIACEAYGAFDTGTGVYKGQTVADYADLAGAMGIDSVNFAELYASDGSNPNFPTAAGGGWSTFKPAITGYYIAKTVWPGCNMPSDELLISRIFKGYFGYSYAENLACGIEAGTFRTGSTDHGYHNIAELAACDGVGAYSVAGSYIITIGDPAIDKNPETPDAPPGDDLGVKLDGQYTWHMNDQHLEGGAGKYKEDQSVICSGGGDESIEITGLGLKQEQQRNWVRALEKAGSVNATVKYSAVWTVIQDDVPVVQRFTMNRDAILNGGLRSKSKTISFGAGEFKQHIITGDDWLGSPFDIELQAPNSSWTEYSVAIATSMTVDFAGNPNGAPIKMVNDQVHYAIHGTDEKRTYKFIQEPELGKAQIRDEAIDSNQYDVTDSIPTTNDLMITMGGDVFVVNMQYRYCIDDYVRTYKLDAAEVPNYMWYGLKPVKGSNHWGHGHTATLKGYNDEDSRVSKNPAYYTPITDKGTYTRTSEDDNDDDTEHNKQQTKDYKEAITHAYDDFVESCKALTTNAYSFSGSEDYKAIITKIVPGEGTLDITVKGRDISALQGTVDALKDYYCEWLYPMYKEYGKNSTPVEGMLELANSKYSNPGGIFTVDMVLCDTNRDLDSPAYVPLKWTLGFKASAYADSPKDKKWCNKKNCPCHSERCSNGSGDCERGQEDTSKPADPVTGKHPEKGCECGECTHYGTAAGDKQHHVDSKFIYKWKYDINYTSDVNPGDFLNEDKSSGDLTLGRQVGYHANMKQVFHNVKYMDIIDCHVWRLHKGYVKGLAGLIESDTTFLSTNQKDALELKDDILQMYCNTYGYEIYNVNQPNQDKWDKTYKDSDGSATSTGGAWRCVNSNDLQKIDRLSNSYYKKDPSNATHAFKPIWGDPDNIKYTYDIKTQGGRSHQCIEGFIKQALACTFYEKGTAEVNKATASNRFDAVRNWIVVQGDYLTLKPNNMQLSLCGMQYNTKDLMDSKTQPKIDTNETFAILHTTSSDISVFNRSDGKFFTIDKGNSKPESNNGSGAQNGFENVRNSRGQLKTIDTYMEKDATNQKSSLGESAMGGGYGDIYLDKTNNNKQTVQGINVPYCNLTVKLANETQQSSSGLTNFTNLGVDPLEGKVPANSMPWIGYDGSSSNMTSSAFLFKANALPAGFNAMNAMHKTAFDEYNHGGVKGFYDDTPETNKVSIPRAIGGYVPAKYGSTPHEYYPHTDGININLFAPNAVYSGETGAIEYDKICSYFISYPGCVSVDTYTGAQVGVSDYFPADKAAAYPIGDFATDDSKKDIIGSAGPGAGILVAAGTNGTTLNSVHVYNPVACDEVYIIKNDGKLTDGTGQGKYNDADQRISPIEYNSESGETYITDTNTSGSTIKIPGQINYELKPNGSDLDTQYYTKDDYANTQDDVINKVEVAGGESTVIQNSGNYVLSLHANNASSSATTILNLSARDTLHNTGTVITLERARSSVHGVSFEDIRQAVLAWEKSQWVPANPEEDVFTSPNETSKNLTLKKNSVLTFDLSSLPVKAGDLITLTLPTVESCANPFEVTWTGYTKECSVHQISTDGNTHKFSIEVAEDGALGAVEVKVLNNCTLSEFTNSCLNFEDIFVMSVGDNADPLKVTSYAYTYEYENAFENYAYNSYIASGIDIDIAAKYNVVINANTLYCIQESVQLNNTLNSIASSDPHKVANANWRYYVVGWKTKEGKLINSIDSPLLENDAQVLVMPSGVEVSIADIKSSYVIVSFNRSLYLSSRVDAMNHKITSTGVQITGDNPHFDYIDVNANIDTLTELKFDNWSDTGYPLKPIGAGPGCVAESNGLPYYTSRCELVVQVSDVDAALFSVKYATNLKYKYAKTDTKAYHDGKENRKWDYNEVEVGARLVTVSNGQAPNRNQPYVVLDDKFQLHWDNFTQLRKGDVNRNAVASEAGSYSLSTGYENKFNEELEFDGDKMNTYPDYWLTSAANGETNAEGEIETSYRVAYYSNYDSSNLYDRVEKPNKTASITDTTKYIYSKTVTFSIPVYVFSCSADKDNPYGYNPAVEASTVNCRYAEKHGVACTHTVHLIPAGTPIHLGYFASGVVDDHNGGNFIDFGAPSYCQSAHDDVTKSYTYNFYAALGAGESNNCIASCETLAVNAIKNKEQAEEYRTKNERPVDMHMCNNSNYTNATAGADGECQHNAKNNTSFALIGRIGALTVVESDDPRYADTFKHVPSSKNSTDDYLIYPLVKKIESYANIPSKDGTQHRYLIDPWDVRGRISSEDMLSIVKTNSALASKYAGYQVYATTGAHYDAYDGEYNTYGTQWFKGKQSSDASHVDTNGKNGMGTYTLTERYALPMTPNFNAHRELKLTPLRIGYNVFCSLESIGEYYGFSSIYTSEPNASYVGDANAAGDIGQDKVQVRPRYFWISKDGKKCEPVDVYMNSNSGYVMINTASDNPKDFLPLLYNNRCMYSIDRNTGKDETDLDQNMLRRMVTNYEAQITKDVITELNTKSPEELAQWNIPAGATYTRSLLTPEFYDAKYIGDTYLNTTYTYGNAQFLFLRERNRTFVGGDTVGVEYGDSASVNHGAANAITNAGDNLEWKMNAQKWYFGLGLPSSSVFMKTGEMFDLNKCYKDGYILVTIDVIAKGHVWTLQYKSDVARMNIDIGGNSIEYTKWQPDASNKWYIPVTYYALGDGYYTSQADLDTEGTH